MWASLLESLPVSLSAADFPAPIANPTETSETLTSEEMIALLAGSKVTYRYQLVGDDLSTYRTGKGIVQVLSPTSFTFYDWAKLVYIAFPIDFQQSDLYSFECIFELPIYIKSCVSLVTSVAPSAYSSISKSAYGALSFDLNMEYQLDSGSEVVTNRKFYAPENGSSVTYSYDFCKLSNNMYGSFTASTSLEYGPVFAYGTLDNPKADRYKTVTLNGLSKDVSAFGFVWKSYSQNQTGYDSDTLGIGFWVHDFIINYNAGGGYDPSGGGSGSGGEGGEEGGGSGGSSPDYSAQLDKLYEELVKQGQIQQSQNSAILQQHQEILDAQKEQTEQDKQLWEDTFDPSEEDQAAVQDDFDANADELKEKLGFFEFLDQFFQGFVDIFDVDVGDGFPTLDIPAIGFDMPDGSHVTIWDDFTVDLAVYLAPFKTVLSAIKFFTSLIFIGAFLNYCYDWLHGLLNSWQNDDIIMVDPTTGEVI